MNNEKSKSVFGKERWLILLLFGTIGQIAWSVENMFFNLFAYEIFPDLDTVTLMVQLSGIVATVATLVAGTLADKLGNRRAFISWGYLIWGATVALFGCLSPSLTEAVFGVGGDKAITLTLALVVIGDCVMTLFGSTANDAAFNAWVTDNTTHENRGTVEGVLSILPLIALLIVAGGFGILKDVLGGFRNLFLLLGVVISLVGVYGIFKVRDSESLKRSGSFRDILYGFRPSVIKTNAPFYVTLIIVLIYGIACQIFMPYLIIFMTTYLGFEVLEYSLVFGIAILGGAAVNLYLTRLSDKMDKTRLLYFASAILAVGLLMMYFFSMLENKIALLILFGIGGFVMICGYIFVNALCGSTVRDNTPSEAVGKLQGVRMVFSVLIPMLVGPAIGNAINSSRGILIPDPGADAMTTEYIPAPEIFLAGAIATLLIFAVIPLLSRLSAKKSAT
jgi:MFS family permease